MGTNIVEQKSKEFAIYIIRLYKILLRDTKEFVLSKQLLRAGTSIGANICEAKYAQSKADFISKMSIALKEAAESKYWLELLQEGDYITSSDFKTYSSLADELIKILCSITKTSKEGLE